MPSPFPGMDPYLEGPEFYPDLHDRLINALSDQLQDRLPPSYFAQMRSRVWVEYSDRIVEPDVSLLRGQATPTANGGGTATAIAVSVRPVVVQVPNDETREVFLEVYSTKGERRLVTGIEVLSPSNKTPGEQGQQLYQQKQRELLRSKVHLVEIDLLRGGQHSTAVPLEEARTQAGAFDYHVCVRRFDVLGQYLVYPIRLEDRLPQIAIPLLSEDAPVVIDLQAVFDHCYDVGPYRRAGAYAGRKPVPPLTPERQAWAEGVLREKGLTP